MNRQIEIKNTLGQKIELVILSGYELKIDLKEAVVGILFCKNLNGNQSQVIKLVKQSIGKTIEKKSTNFMLVIFLL